MTILDAVKVTGMPLSLSGCNQQKLKKDRKLHVQNRIARPDKDQIIRR